MAFDAGYRINNRTLYRSERWQPLQSRGSPWTKKPSLDYYQGARMQNDTDDSGGGGAMIAFKTLERTPPFALLF